MHTDTLSDPHPPAERLEDFDTNTGSWLERSVFNHRPWVLGLCLLLTLLLGWQALRLPLNASFEKTIPTAHPYIANYLAHRADLAGQGNTLRLVLEARQGTIFEPAYLEALQKINDEVFLIPGVDRPFMKSLWTSNTRWVAVTEDGLDGGPVVPDSYDGSPASLAELRANVERSGEIGSLVAADFRSSSVLIPLLERHPETGVPLDYAALSAQLEALRERHSNEHLQVRITGFAKVVGDLIDGLYLVLAFFVLALLICSGILLAYTRCLRSTMLVVTCSVVAVLWQFGLLTLLGYALDPYSVLVPFLVFAIGMSHGAQKMNGIMQDMGRGTHRLVAARLTFRRLFMAGLTALLCDAVGFAVLMIIRIEVIQDLAVIASLGVAVLIFTNLVLLPVLLSYTGVAPAAAQRSLRQDSGQGGLARLWTWLGHFTEPRWALGTLAVAAVLAVGGAVVSRELKIGDLDPGASELRPESRYNQDNAYLINHYGASSDILTVMAITPPDRCTAYAALAQVDALSWQLEQLPGVEATQSMASLSRMAMVGYNEGNFKWLDLLANDGALGGVQTRAPRELFNQNCSFLALYVYLKDHKADTLNRVVQAVEAYAATHNNDAVRFELAAGSAGIAAATNIVVEEANRQMLLWVYAAVIALCWVTFRSWRAVVVAVLPLVLTSVLCEALMVALGIGVKVATLPVIALGVGIGVDYALYVLSIILARQRLGDTLAQAYGHALQFTGRVVMLTGVTLALAVGTWVFSPIKFQADMGLLLAFMFLWNMVGALTLLPALSYVLLRPKPLAHQEAQAAPSALALSK
ncbi:MMPL family transporter [Curvibacter sp. RS43]|uniref:efflux RND transporter permease subunit n=1 Tax=Curvibacter microcysteis TaxID=3026419 RepID=UPI00235FC38E|nr:MMPL family transporter [Curvibacter sp. RS43]MDD0809273.1 MMPL family transporter [Curvibacter sp. RS43]